jgi:predicted  nucleic acid-binding Zn-ribbon protein
MEHKCPKCGSVIYSRRNMLCGVCGERLPPELLFTAEERDAVERDLAEAKRRAREARLGSQSDSGGTDPSSGLSSTDFGDVP